MRDANKNGGGGPVRVRSFSFKRSGAETLIAASNKRERERERGENMGPFRRFHSAPSFFPPQGEGERRLLIVEVRA